ncbi:hypothetical protein OF83DRAFT_814954 [Amylostereum chailletii]|nr:hypothetical protein OF83DRAFT_814954 [Amylostereum chailletii]
MSSVRSKSSPGLFFFSSFRPLELWNGPSPLLSSVSFPFPAFLSSGFFPPRRGSTSDSLHALPFPLLDTDTGRARTSAFGRATLRVLPFLPLPETSRARARAVFTRRAARAAGDVECPPCPSASLPPLLPLPSSLNAIDRDVHSRPFGFDPSVLHAIHTPRPTPHAPRHKYPCQLTSFLSLPPSPPCVYIRPLPFLLSPSSRSLTLTKSNNAPPPPPVPTHRSTNNTPRRLPSPSQHIYVLLPPLSQALSPSRHPSPSRSLRPHPRSRPSNYSRRPSL